MQTYGPVPEQVLDVVETIDQTLYLNCDTVKGRSFNMDEGWGKVADDLLGGCAELLAKQEVISDFDQLSLYMKERIKKAIVDLGRYNARIIF